MEKDAFILTSDGFKNNEMMPEQYTHQGYAPGSQNQSPPLHWKNPPPETKSFALICSDPDAVVGVFTHWVLYNISEKVSDLPAGLPQQEALSHALDGARQGRNDYGFLGYGGPKPPPGTGIHRYVFTLYALNTVLELPWGASVQDLMKAMGGHVLATAQLVGLCGVAETT